MSQSWSVSPIILNFDTFQFCIFCNNIISHYLISANQFTKLIIQQTIFLKVESILDTGTFSPEHAVDDYYIILDVKLCKLYLYVSSVH